MKRRIFKAVYYFIFLIISDPVSAGIRLTNLDFWKYEHLENEAIRSGVNRQLSTRPQIQEVGESQFFWEGLQLEFSSSSTIPNVEKREGNWITKGQNSLLSTSFGWIGDSMTFWVQPQYSQHENLAADERSQGKYQPASTALLRFPEEENSYTTSSLHSAYILIPFFNWYLFGGKDNLRFGPGKHGNLQLGNSAEPFPMLRLGTQQPIDTRLGYFSFLTYIGQMEGDRHIPNPKFSGMRITLSTEKRLEFGLSRSWFAGGERQDNSFSHTYWDLYTEFFKPKKGSENWSDFRNQQLVLDFRINIPEISSVFYGEWGREDHQFSWKDSIKYWDSTHAYILGFKQIGLVPNSFWLIEYADNSQPTRYPAAAVWYNHGEYRNGWSYKNINLGHPMGPDSRDLFFGFGWETLEHSLMFYGDYEVHGIRTIAPEQQEQKAEVGVKGFWQINSGLFIDFQIQQQNIRILLLLRAILLILR